MSKDTSLEARFEGYPVEEYGVAPIPNLLFKHYYNLGLNDGQFTLLCHIISRKWTKEAPYPTITHIPMSANIDTRRRYVREMRNQGLVFTARLYWTHKDAEENPRAKPGKVRSNLWYLGSLLYNLERMEQWLSKGNKADDFIIEIPQATVELYLDGQLNDVPEQIAKVIDRQTQSVGRAIPVLVCLLSEKLLREKRIVDISDDLVCENQVVENHIVMNKNHDSNNINTNTPTCAPAKQSLDPVAHALVLRATYNPQASEPGDYEKYFGSRDEFLKIYVREVGSHPNQVFKDEIIRLSQLPDADPERWERAIRETLMNFSGNGPPPPIRYIEVYEHGGGDYEKFTEWMIKTGKWNNNNGGKANGQAAVEIRQSKANGKAQKTSRGNGRRNGPIWGIPPTSIPDV